MVFQRKKEYITMVFLLMFIEIIIHTIQGTYDIVDMVWNLGSYIKVKRVVDLVHSRDSNYLWIRLISFDQVNL